MPQPVKIFQDDSLIMPASFWYRLDNTVVELFQYLSLASRSPTMSPGERPTVIAMITLAKVSKDQNVLHASHKMIPVLSDFTPSNLIRECPRTISRGRCEAKPHAYDSLVGSTRTLVGVALCGPQLSSKPGPPNRQWLMNRLGSQRCNGAPRTYGYRQMPQHHWHVGT